MASPTPAPNAPAFCFSSSPASSSSSRASVLACSATCLAAAPTPGCSVSAPGVGMTPPVDHLREQRPDAEGGRGDDERVRPGRGLPAAVLGAVRGGGRTDGSRSGLGVLRQLALGAPRDQGGLELAQEGRVVGELVRDLAAETALPGGLVRQLLELVRPRLDRAVALHRFAGGFSPVATRQMLDARRRETIVATAPMAP